MFTRARSVPRLYVTFRNKLVSSYKELLLPRPTPMLENHPFSAVYDCLLNIFIVTPRIRMPCPLLQPEDKPCLGDTDPHIVACGSVQNLYLNGQRYKHTYNNKGTEVPVSRKELCATLLDHWASSDLILCLRLRNSSFRTLKPRFYWMGHVSQ
jgi:hypothetical protein